MLQLPPEFYHQISAFADAFTKPTWKKARLLLIGAILCPGSRTICNVLRAVGLKDEKKFDKYHAVLYRARWSALKLASVLLRLLVDTFVRADEALVFGIDETIERRWGRLIAKRGIYRDAVRTSASHFVKCSGLRWMSMMLLTNLPWLAVNRFWALPFLTALCPSARFYQKRDQSRAPKKLTDWARQMLLWLGRYAKPWNRPVYLVGDGSYAVYELMIKAQELDVGLIARMKMNARLFGFPPPQPKSKRGRKPQTGNRLLSMDKRLTDKRIKWEQVTFSQWYGAKDKTMLITTGTAIWDSNKGVRVPLRWVLIKDPDGQLEPVLLGCSNLHATAPEVVNFFVRRWRVEVTFAEVRRHLGVETQRQWSELSIERTTPVLMATKAIVCLLGKKLWDKGKLDIQSAAWYDKNHFTFSDVLCAVRKHIWVKTNFPTSTKHSYVGKLKQRIRYLEQALLLAAA
jgi:hypothetical protein